MLELPAVETGNRLSKRGRGSFDIRIGGVGAQYRSADLIVIELYAKRFLDVGDAGARPYVEIVRTDPNDCEIVRCQKILHDFRLGRRGRESRRDFGALEPAAIRRGTRVVPVAHQRVELASIV